MKIKILDRFVKSCYVANSWQHYFLCKKNVLCCYSGVWGKFSVDFQVGGSKQHFAEWAGGTRKKFC